MGGIRLRAASTLVAVGVALGGIGGGAVVAALIGAGGPAQAPAALASPTPLATPVATPVDATVVVPPRARTGFAQARAVNERLAHSASLLRKAVLARASAGEIAAILRKISADGTYGGQVAIRLAGWPPSLSLADRLASFYADLAASARSGLANALSDDAAYLASARTTLRVLRALGPVSVATLAEAVAHGLVVPGESAAP